MGIRNCSRRLRVSRRLGVLGLAAALILGACSSGSGDSSKKADKPLNVLYVSGLTGLLAPGAQAFKRGIQAQVDYINDNGGILGRKVSLTTRDNQSDPTRAVTIVQKALNSGTKPDLVIPGVSSNEALAVAPVLTRQKVVTIVSSSSPLLDDAKKYPYLFSYCPLQKDYLSAAAPFIAKHGTVRKVALLAPDDALGDATEANFKAAFAKEGIQTSATRFPGDAIDFTPAFQKALGGHPDWLFMEGAGAQVPIMLSSRVKAGAENTPTVVGVTASSQPLLKLATGKQLNDLYATLLPLQPYIAPDARGDQFKEMFKRVTAQGPLDQPLYSYAAGWDMVGLWASAIKNAHGDVSSDSIKKSLESLPASTDPQFPIFGGKYSSTTHFAHDVSKLEFAQLSGTKDGMLLTK